MTLVYDLSLYCFSYPSRPACHTYERFPQVNGRQASVSVSTEFLIEVFNIIITALLINPSCPNSTYYTCAVDWLTFHMRGQP
jgi:hypothetical protein